MGTNVLTTTRHELYYHIIVAQRRVGNLMPGQDHCKHSAWRKAHFCTQKVR